MSAGVNSDNEPEIQILSDEQAKRQFEETVRRHFKMSSDEFLKKLRAGEFKINCDDSNLLQVLSLIPKSLR